MTHHFTYLAAVTGLVLGLCDEDEPPVPDTTAAHSTAEQVSAPAELEAVTRRYVPRLKALAGDATPACRETFDDEGSAGVRGGRPNPQRDGAVDPDPADDFRPFAALEWIERDEPLQITIECMAEPDSAGETARSPLAPGGVGTRLAVLRDQSNVAAAQKVPLNQCKFGVSEAGTKGCYDYTKEMVSVHHRERLAPGRFVEVRVDLDREGLGLKPGSQ